MEPMTLGSPVQSPQQHHNVHSLNLSSVPMQPSPVNPVPHGSSTNTAGTGFLPGFLMGDYSQQGTGRMVSPTKANRSISLGSGGSNPVQLTPQTPLPARINGFLTPSTPASPGATLRTPSDKPGGPPTNGLFSTPKTHLLHRSGIDSAPGTPRGVLNTPNPTTPQLSFGGTPSGTRHLNGCSSVQDNVNHSSCQDGTTWVTVFGFPPSACSYILQQFSQCGTVLQHHTPANGNWMHIRYQTRTQAQSALSRSGKVLGGSLMIGVVLAQESDIPTEGGLLEQSRMNSSVATINNSSVYTPSKSSIRPLAQVYKSSHNEHEMSMSSTSASKTDGLVGRAMEYIFGW